MADSGVSELLGKLLRHQVGLLRPEILHDSPEAVACSCIRMLARARSLLVAQYLEEWLQEYFDEVIISFRLEHLWECELEDLSHACRTSIVYYL